MVAYAGQVPNGVERTIAGRGGGEIRGATIHRVIGYLRPHRFAVVAALACLIAQSLLALIPFVIVRRLIVDLQHPGGSFSTILVLVLAGLGLVLLAGLVYVLRSWIVLRITTGIVAGIRRQLVQRLLGQSISYFTAERGGDLMSRLLNDVNVVENALGDSALSFLGNVLTAVVFIIAMVVVQWQLAVVTIALLPLLVFSMRRAGRPVYRTRRDLQERLGAFTIHAQEVLSLSGIMLVKSFGREAAELERSYGLAEDLRRSDIRAGMTARWIGLGFQLAQALAPLALLLVGAWLIEHRDAGLSTVIAFVAVLALRFGAALAGAGNGAVSVIGALPAWDRLFAVLDAHVEIRELPDARTLEHPCGAVRFEHMSYTYPRQPRPAIDDMSLDVAPGQLIALVGPSGAGKTTLTNVAGPFLRPPSGQRSDRRP